MHFLDHQSEDRSPHPLPSRNACREWQRAMGSGLRRRRSAWLHSCTGSGLVGAGGDRQSSKPSWWRVPDWEPKRCRVAPAASWGHRVHPEPQISTPIPCLRHNALLSLRPTSQMAGFSLLPQDFEKLPVPVLCPRFPVTQVPDSGFAFRWPPNDYGGLLSASHLGLDWKLAYSPPTHTHTQHKPETPT